MIRALLVALLLAVPTAAAAQSHLLVVAGLGGEPSYSAAFHGWAMAMADAAESRYGLPGDRITVLTEAPERAPGRIAGRSTRDAVVESLRQIAGRARPGDAVIVLLIGHGGGEGDESRLSLPGPDLSARELAAALAPLAAQKVAIVNAASASGGFIEALSGKNRIVVTATQSPMERNETMFGEFFVAAFAADGADADKDARVSILEAYDFARREVERRYQEENRLLTEHALLDDNGDGEGTREPGGATGDGSLARTLALVGGTASASGATPAASPELRGLLEEQRRLEGEMAALRARKEGMPEAEYQSELERLLLEIARVGRAIREKGGG